MLTNIKRKVESGEFDVNRMALSDLIKQLKPIYKYMYSEDLYALPEFDLLSDDGK
jgi:hypothetical protein